MSCFSRDPGHVFPGNGNPKSPGIPGIFPSRDSRPTALFVDDFKARSNGLEGEKGNANMRWPQERDK